MAFALAYYYKNSVEESEIWRKADKTTNGTAPIKMLDRRKSAKLPAGVHGHDGILVAFECIARRHAGLARLANGRGKRRNDNCSGHRVSCACCRLRRQWRDKPAHRAQSLPPDREHECGYLGNALVLVVARDALSTVYINERFRTSVRASGFGLGYSLAIILPAFYVFYQAWLANFMPFKYTVLVLVVVGALLVFIGAAWGPETKEVDFGPVALRNNNEKS